MPRNKPLTGKPADESARRLASAAPRAAATVQARRVAADGGPPETVQRVLPDETPVALVFNDISHAVMLATPADLEDFALGFALSEGIVAAAGDVHDIDVIPQEQGIEVRLSIASRRFMALKARRRSLVGATGCGLCGVDSLQQASPDLPHNASEFAIAADALRRGLAALPGLQTLNIATGAAHAAAWCDAGGTIVCLREDVGRHNALDKLIGALAAKGTDLTTGALLLTSRCSVELVNKAAMVGMPVMVAVSAPTARALRTAQQAGITLVGLARADSMLAFCHAERILTAAPADAETPT